MNRDNRFCPGRNLCFDFGRVDIEGFGVNIDKHRPGPQTGYATTGGKKSVGCGDNLVARLNIEGHHRHQQSIGARGNAQGKFRVTVSGQLFF